MVSVIIWEIQIKQLFISPNFRAGQIFLLFCSLLFKNLTDLQQILQIKKNLGLTKK